MKKLFSLTLFFVFVICPSFWAQSFQNATVHFDSDVAILDTRDKEALQSFVNDVKYFTESAITIVGHTDQDGSDIYNKALSKKRAESVKDFLVEKGIASTTISLDYKGEFELLNNTNDPLTKSQNRRVSISAESYFYDKSEALIKHLVPDDTEQHSIDPTQESSLKLKRGTTVTIPNNAFCKKDGTPIEDGLVKLEFKEAFDYLEMIDLSLSTQTEDQQLETGGMIYISASQNGEELKLREGQEVSMLYPLQKGQEGMELFSGVEDERGVIWEETGKEITAVKEKKETPFVKVDLSGILSFDLRVDEVDMPDFGPLSAYPHPVKKAHAPYSGNYSKEKYQEVLKEYEEIMEAYHEDQKDRPQRLAAWHRRVDKRKQYLYDLRSARIQSLLYKRLKVSVVNLREQKESVSHDILVKNVFAFLNKPLGKIPFDDDLILKKVYGDERFDVVKYGGIKSKNYKAIKASVFCPLFSLSLEQVNVMIINAKGGNASLNKNQFSRYLVASANLGWINVDKYYELAEEDKTNLEFANLNEGAQYYLIFKDIRSIIRPRKIEGKVIFKGVPTNKDVRLVAFDVDNDKALFASQDLTISKDNQVDLKFISSNVIKMRRALSSM